MRLSPRNATSPALSIRRGSRHRSRISPISRASGQNGAASGSRPQGKRRTRTVPPAARAMAAIIRRPSGSQWPSMLKVAKGGNSASRPASRTIVSATSGR